MAWQELPSPRFKETNGTRHQNVQFHVGGISINDYISPQNSDSWCNSYPEGELRASLINLLHDLCKSQGIVYKSFVNTLSTKYALRLLFNNAMAQHQRIYSIISIVQRRCILGPAFPCFTSHHLDGANIAFIIICFHGWGWLKIDTFLSYETSKTVDLEMTLLLESHCLLSSSLPFWFVSLRTACWPNGRVVRSISRVQVAPSIERNGFRLALPYFDLSLSDPFWVSIN